MRDNLLERSQRAAWTAVVFGTIGPLIGFLVLGVAALVFGHPDPRLPVHHDPGALVGMIFFLAFVALLASPLIFKLGFLAALLSGALSGFATSRERPFCFLLIAVVTGATSSAAIPLATLDNVRHPFLRGMVVGNGPEVLAAVGAVSAALCAWIMIAVRRNRTA